MLRKKKKLLLAYIGDRIKDISDVGSCRAVILNRDGDATHVLSETEQPGCLTFTPIAGHEDEFWEKVNEGELECFTWYNEAVIGWADFPNIGLATVYDYSKFREILGSTFDETDKDEPKEKRISDMLARARPSEQFGPQLAYALD